MFTNRRLCAYSVARNIAYVTGAILLCLSLYVQYLPIVYGDKQYALYYARQWLDGKNLYHDIFPVSPPLFFWLYALPAAAAKYFPFISDLHALFWFGLLALAASLVTCLRLIRLSATSGFSQLQFGLLFCFILIFRTYPQYYLDREHLFLVLIFPYLLRCMPSIRDSTLPLTLRIAIGVMAAVGFCIKPHCLIVFAGVQLTVAIGDSSLRIFKCTENLIIYGLTFVYCLLVWALYPDYFFVTLPMSLATYSAVRDESPLWDYVSNTVYILIPALLMFRPGKSSPYRRDIYYFLALCPFFLGYALANNNWSYTYYPLGSIALVVAGFVMKEFIYLARDYKMQGRSSIVWCIGIGLCSAIFLFKIFISLSLFQSLIRYGCLDNANCEGDGVFISELTQNGSPALSFGSISISYSRWVRVSRYSAAPWETRFYQLWMLPRLLLADEAFLQAHQWIINYVGRGLAEDMTQRKPEVMFVDDNNLFYTAHMHVNLPAYFSVVPEFSEAWKSYRYLHSIDNCGPAGSIGQRYKINCRYDVYRRIH